MNLNALRLFNQVAHRGSFSGAAVAASISQPAISRAVAELEASLGFKLFDRSRRPLALTPAGHCLFGHAETIFRAEREAQRQLHDMRGAPLRQVRIAASAFLAEHVLAGAIARFMTLHPAIHVEILPGNLHSAGSWLGSGHADLAVIEGVLAGFEHLSTTPWRPQELALFVPAGHRLAAADAPAALSDLTGETFVHRESGSATGGIIGGLLIAHDAVPARFVEAPSTNIMLALVEAGIGATIAPVEAAAAAVHRGGIVRVALDSGPIVTTTLIAKVDSGVFSDDAKLFRDMLLT